jgi:hypothetical protein
MCSLNGLKSCEGVALCGDPFFFLEWNVSLWVDFHYFVFLASDFPHSPSVGYVPPPFTIYVSCHALHLLFFILAE